MRLLIACCFWITFSDVYSQEAKCIEGKNYMGYIFSDDHDVLLSIQNQEDKFTPGRKEVELFESRLIKRIEGITQYLPDQGKGCPPINKNRLKKYIRQYFGFTTQSGDQILFVNFVWSKGIGTDELDKDLVSVLDGCTHYWRIQYNITKDEFSDLDVNVRS